MRAFGEGVSGVVSGVVSGGVGRWTEGTWAALEMVSFALFFSSVFFFFFFFFFRCQKSNWCRIQSIHSSLAEAETHLTAVRRVLFMLVL